MSTSEDRSRTSPVPAVGRTRAAARRAAVRRSVPALAAAAALTATSVSAAPASAATSVQRTPVMVFQPAGAVGGGVLEPGTLFAPSSAGAATLKRGTDHLQLNLQTSGLPAGAYTVWWIVFGTPDGCSAPCSEDDLGNPAASLSVFWATGGVVRHNGVATFTDRHGVMDDRGAAGQQNIIDSGAFDTRTAEVHNIVRYHGPASMDADTLHAQTHTLMGSCFEGANAIDHGAPMGVQCPDLQAVVFPAP